MPAQIERCQRLARVTAALSGVTPRRAILSRLDHARAHRFKAAITTALRIAIAKRYISPAEFAEVDAALDRIRAMLYRLTR
ncbi:MAG TPA: hypothetical protein VGD80_35560 [Kofleriaceae bacterium]